MCGIAAIFGNDWDVEQLRSMRRVQAHRGPDDRGIFTNRSKTAGLAHNRLSIIDLSSAGHQPMNLGDLWITYNGEIYNFPEIRRELEHDHEFKTKTDTEVLLAAYKKWGASFLNKLIGMFAFVIWNEAEKTAFAARDRFGVKPLYFHHKPNGTLLLASEIKALHSAGIPRDPDPRSWANYFSHGLTDYANNTFWRSIYSLPAGFVLNWKKDGVVNFSRWYDIADRSGNEFDQRAEAEVGEDYFSLMKESVGLRFRSDVPVGINLSGGLDSSSLLSIVNRLKPAASAIKAFTFTTGDEQYDELPWVRSMVEDTGLELVECRLSADEVPDLAASVQRFQDEPFGGLPTLAYARLFETAHKNGVKVLLDGNGMDEQWGGYDYYESALNRSSTGISVVQGSATSSLRPDCLDPEFKKLADFSGFPKVFPDSFRNLQYRDTVFTKIPRAMRYNDRISMRSSIELREPFLDHRLFELAFRQPQDRKRIGANGKTLLRKITSKLLPDNVSLAPKRALQTPQREWLRGELREWAEEQIENGLKNIGCGWFDEDLVRTGWKKYCAGEGDNSFFVWQWISLGLIR